MTLGQHHLGLLCYVNNALCASLQKVDLSATEQNLQQAVPVRGLQ